jgi:hypothetical protein
MLLTAKLLFVLRIVKHENTISDEVQCCYMGNAASTHWIQARVKSRLKALQLQERQVSDGAKCQLVLPPERSLVSRVKIRAVTDRRALHNVGCNTSYKGELAQNHVLLTLLTEWILVKHVL